MKVYRGAILWLVLVLVLAPRQSPRRRHRLVS